MGNSNQKRPLVHRIRESLGMCPHHVYEIYQKLEKTQKSIYDSRTRVTEIIYVNRCTVCGKLQNHRVSSF